ncbi:transcription initiation factor TFIID subunit 12-like isoform X3 [Leptopilina boulardi]|nr:transcription initiation factor TFIID subunit 12-like isoform X3 [Leptopilina boulardi]
MSLDSYENVGKSAIACDVEYVEDNNFLENDEDIKMESYSEYDVLQYDGELIAVDDSCKSNDSISSHKENMKETSNTSDYLSHNFKSFPEEQPTSQMLSEVESSKQIPKKFKMSPITSVQTSIFPPKVHPSEFLSLHEAPSPTAELQPSGEQSSTNCVISKPTVPLSITSAFSPMCSPYTKLQSPRVKSPTITDISKPSVPFSLTSSFSPIRFPVTDLEASGVKSSTLSGIPKPTVPFSPTSSFFPIPSPFAELQLAGVKSSTTVQPNVPLSSSLPASSIRLTLAKLQSPGVKSSPSSTTTEPYVPLSPASSASPIRSPVATFKSSGVKSSTMTTIPKSAMTFSSKSSASPIHFPFADLQSSSIPITSKHDVPFSLPTSQFRLFSPPPPPATLNPVSNRFHDSDEVADFIFEESAELLSAHSSRQISSTIHAQPSNAKYQNKKHFNPTTILGRQMRVADIPKSDLTKKTKVTPPIDRFARQKKKQNEMSRINKTLLKSQSDLHQITTVFTKCMSVQQQVLQNQLHRDREKEREKSEVRADPLFNLFIHKWDLLSDEKQDELFIAALDIISKRQ